jgi:hypothetical protein
MKKTSDLSRRIHKDIFWFVVSIAIALFLVRTGIVIHLLASTIQLQLLGSFIAGLFFTSLFTIAPAGIVLAHIAETTPIIFVAFLGALGAMIGDLLIYKFLQNNLTEDINELLELPRYRRIKRLFGVRKLRILRPFVGAIVIISPLPDEIGLALLGLSRVPVSVMLPLTFMLNFFGILLICYGSGLL